MAHGYLQHFGGDKVVVYSAGVEVHGVNPKAIAAMKEDGVDISSHTSNHISDYQQIGFDYVITVCDNAKERCPFFPSNTVKVHYNFPDPAKATGSEGEVAGEFIRVRDMIKVFCQRFIQERVGC